MEQPYNYAGGVPPVGGPPPKNWLVESILVTIFCCLPFGIVAIINAANVNSRLAVGDYAGAQEASQKAGTWVKYSIIGWVVFFVLYIALMFLGVLGSGVLSSMNS